MELRGASGSNGRIFRTTPELSYKIRTKRIPPNQTEFLLKMVGYAWHPRAPVAFASFQVAPLPSMPLWLTGAHISLTWLLTPWGKSKPEAYAVAPDARRVVVPDRGPTVPRGVEPAPTTVHTGLA